MPDCLLGTGSPNGKSTSQKLQADSPERELPNEEAREKKENGAGTNSKHLKILRLKLGAHAGMPKREGGRFPGPVSDKILLKCIGFMGLSPEPSIRFFNLSPFFRTIQLETPIKVNVIFRSTRLPQPLLHCTYALDFSYYRRNQGTEKFRW
jgi:hypothetical protein